MNEWQQVRRVEPDITDLERAVIEAALRFRRAETAVWVEGETGTEEAARKAKAERAAAYMALITTVDALIEERSN